MGLEGVEGVFQEVPRQGRTGHQLSAGQLEPQRVRCQFNGEAIQFRAAIGPAAGYTWQTDLYDNDSGSTVSLMDQKSIALFSPRGLQGTCAFGAILRPGSWLPAA